MSLRPMHDFVEPAVAAPPQAAVGGSPTVRAEDYADYARLRRLHRSRRRVLRGGIGIVAMLALWYWAAKAYNIELILPTPIAVFENVFKTLLLRQEKWLYGPSIYVHLEASFLRAVVGFGTAILAAIPLGLLLGRLTSLREFFDPAIRMLYPIPGIAWIPLAILWFGLGDKAVVFVVFMSAAFPLYFTVEAGARHISPLMVEAGRCYGARGPRLFLKVILPAATPYIITGLRIGLGNAWRMIVAGEILASQTGIGFILSQSRFLFRAVDLMTAMILVAVIGYAMEKAVVGTIERRTIERWEVKPT